MLKTSTFQTVKCVSSSDLGSHDYQEFPSNQHHYIHVAPHLHKKESSLKLVSFPGPLFCTTSDIKLGMGACTPVYAPRLSSLFLKGEVGGALLVVCVYLPRYLQYLCVELLDLTPVQ